MAITASMVKELRQRTGAGMMECKKALSEMDGDMEAAIDHMRTTGLAKADKKAGRIAAEGVVVVEVAGDGKTAVMLEINSETDFVSKGDDFNNFVAAVAKLILANKPADVATLNEMALEDGRSVEVARQELIAKIGENIQVRRFELREAAGQLCNYLHGVRIGVLVDIVGGNEALGRDVAMHIAASRPVCISEEQVPAEILEKEKAIFVAQAKESGKPDNIIEKMIVGRMRKYLAEITLLGQAFVKDPDQSVAKLLKDAGASVAYFQCLEVGEGIEKKVENFADEVMAQAQGS